MGTTAVGNASTTPAGLGMTTPVVAKNTLGKDEFLKLLTAQLANQDPLAPVDNQAFIAQLAQFSSVEQMQNVAGKLDTLLLATASQSQLSTTALVGKSIAYKADGMTVEAGKGPPAVQARLAARGAVTAVIQDDSGRTVRTVALGVHDAGSFDLGWDGRDDAGNAVPPGHYTVKLAAKAIDGTAVEVSARATGLVTGVSFDGDAAELLVGGQRVKLGDVVQISQP